MQDHQVSYLKSPVRNGLHPCSRCHKVYYRSEMVRNTKRQILCITCRVAPGEFRAWRSPSYTNWRVDAVCAGADPEIFFPKNRAIYNLPDAPWRKYCLRCPVAAFCKMEAESSKSVGVFGGEFFEGTGQHKSENPGGTGLPGRPRKVQHDT